MTAHAIALALEQDGFAVHHPAGIFAHIATLGDGMNLSTFSTDDTLVGVWVALVGYVTQHEPLAVRTPLKVESSVLVIPIAAVGHLCHLLGLQVHHLQFDTVFYKCQFLAIRTVFGIATLHLGEINLPFQFQCGQLWEYTFFLYQRRVGKVQILIPYDAGGVELPVAVAF